MVITIHNGDLLFERFEWAAYAFHRPVSTSTNGVPELPNIRFILAPNVQGHKKGKRLYLYYTD